MLIFDNFVQKYINIKYYSIVHCHTDKKSIKIMFLAKKAIFKIMEA